MARVDTIETDDGRSVELRPVEVQLEDDAVSALEINASRAGQQWAQDPFVRSVADRDRVTEALEQTSVELALAVGDVQQHRPFESIIHRVLPSYR